MLRLAHITLTQFKNYHFSSFDFTGRVTGICGLNGKGKTNLLDAIYYLGFTRSYFSGSDQQNARFGHEGFRLEGNYERNGKAENLVCIFRGAGKKEIALDEVAYEKFSAHIGHFPCVMVAPDDVELITGASEERRRYMDTLLSQLDLQYLQQLIIYTRVLQQRNSLLKRFAELGQTDWTLLDVLDLQLSEPGAYLYQQRRRLAEQLVPLVQSFYQRIAGEEEKVTLSYESQLHQGDFNAVLNQFREKDFMLQRTNGGIHKDDLAVRLNDQVFRQIASQGQRKSLLFALKLAEYELLKQGKGFPPILLLDDVFEKLDRNRMQNLLQWVCLENSGQVFITDTHSERLEEAFTAIGATCQLIHL